MRDLGNERIRAKLEIGFNHPLVFLPIFAMLLFSCQAGGPSGALTADTSEQSVAHPFDLFYKQIYGSQVLGPAISSLKTEQGFQVQYFQNGKLVSNPVTGEITIAPLGLELGFVSAPSTIQSHEIYELFEPIYDTAGGAGVFGRPISDIQLNVDQARLEQHFENLGLYQRLDEDSANAFGFLYYGVMACGFDCRYDPPTYGIIEMADTLHGPFRELQTSLGEAVTGDLLVAPRQLPNGEVEAIFENLVLYTRPENPGQVHYRPIMELLDMGNEQLVPRLYNDDLEFYGIDGELGHNIPSLFVEYLEQHGGFSLSGAPISEIEKEDDQTYNQYFQNVCLQYKVDPTHGNMISFASVGHLYQAAQPAEVSPAELVIPLTVTAWEEINMIGTTENQTLYVGVFDEAIPQFGVQAEIRVLLPDGQELFYLPPPTDASGKNQCVTSDHHGPPPVNCQL